MLRRSRRQELAETSSAHALAFVLAKQPQPISPAALVDAWKSAWAAVPPPTDIAAEDGVLAFKLGELSGSVALMPAPIPADELDGPAQTSWLWPDAAEAVGRSRAHFVVWATGPVPQAQVHAATTRLVVAVLRACDGLGVYWGDAGHVVRADVFGALAEVLDEGGLPLMLWLDLRAYVEDGRATVFTVGMSAFGLMDLEVAEAGRPVGELREMLTGIARYLIDNGPVIADGDTVGGTAEERIVVRYAASIVDRPGDVYRLDGA